MWLPKLETVTYKRDTDGLLSYVGAEYAKTCVVVEFPPLLPSSSFSFFFVGSPAVALRGLL